MAKLCVAEAASLQRLRSACSDVRAVGGRRVTAAVPARTR